MKLLRNTLAALCMAAAALAAQAEVVRVSITADYTLPPLLAGLGSLSVGFDIAEPMVGVIPEFDTSFRVENLRLEATFNGSTVVNTSNQVGWFNYADSNYFGVDLRLRNLLVAGDYIQMILTTPDVLYAGTTDTPLLNRLSMSGLGGSIDYYPTGRGGPSASGWLSTATYDVRLASGPTRVPEPATALMVPLGLLLAALHKRRQRT